jgi:hypothetical protein
VSTKPIRLADVQFWPIENLTPYELNVKKHDKEQVAKIVAAILKTGKFDQPIVVDRHGVIIKGHGRRLAGLELGMKTVPVVVHADLTPEEVRAMRLDDNRVSISDIDTDMFKLELSELGADALRGTFDDKELEFMAADLGAVNMDAFVTDMGKVLDDQKADMEERAERVAESRVPLIKAFGFKDMAASDQIHITRLMAKAEAATGLEGADALGLYAASM